MRPLAEAFCRVVFTTIRRGWWWHADATELFLPAGGGRVKRLSYINNRVLLCQAARFYKKIEQTLCRSSKIFVWWSQRIKLTTLNRVAGACLLIRWYRLPLRQKMTKVFFHHNAWFWCFWCVCTLSLKSSFPDSETLETVEHKTHVTGALMSKETMILRWHPRSPNWHSRLIAQLSLNQKVLCFMWVCGSNTHPGYISPTARAARGNQIHSRNFWEPCPKPCSQNLPQSLRLDCVWSHYKEPAACNDS